jgi:hypothetical protein
MNDAHLRNLERKIELEARARKKIQVQGGNNVLVSTFGDKVVVDTNLEEASSATCTHWDVVFKDQTSGENPKATLTVPNGMVNGLFPENKEDIGSVTKEDEENWLYLEVKMRENNVDYATYRVSNSKPDTLFNLEKELPTDVQILLAFIGPNFYVQKFTGCGHIRIYPKIAYYSYDDSQKEIIPFYTHELYYA